MQYMTVLGRDHCSLSKYNASFITALMFSESYSVCRLIEAYEVHQKLQRELQVVKKHRMSAADTSRYVRQLFLRVKVRKRQTLICVAPCCDHTCKALRYGTHSQGISQFYLHTWHTSANGMNHTCLCILSRSRYSFTDPQRDGRLSWPWVAGWLHTEMSVRHQELNPDTVAHLSTNRV